MNKLYYHRNRYEKSKHIQNADKYIAELESYIPNEIIDEYTYSETFRQVLSLCSDTFKPDQFDSYFGGLLQLLDQDFMDWLLSHQNELKRQLTWKQICQLQCNYSGWRFFDMAHIPLPEMTIREIWNFGNEQQKQELQNKLYSKNMP